MKLLRSKKAKSGQKYSIVLLESENFISDRPMIDRWASRNCTDVCKSKALKPNIAMAFASYEDMNRFRRWVRNGCK